MWLQLNVGFLLWPFEPFPCPNRELGLESLSWPGSLLTISCLISAVFSSSSCLTPSYKFVTSKSIPTLSSGVINRGQLLSPPLKHQIQDIFNWCSQVAFVIKCCVTAQMRPLNAYKHFYKHWSPLWISKEHFSSCVMFFMHSKHVYLQTCQASIHTGAMLCVGS